ncbi:MAG TPA: chromate efflux transporter [Aestuariivirgaceae bacterium]|jgi:chromate transporter
MNETSFKEALSVWARIGLLSFGGPAAQIALMHRVLVEEKKWLSDQRFLHALNFCMLLPGPEAMQLATYAGWKLHGWRGGLVAGLLFVLPGACVVLILSMLYVAFGAVPWVIALFFGIKAAVLAIVIEALLRVARRALKLASDWWIAAAAFVALFAFATPFPLVVLAAALIGLFRTTLSSPVAAPPLIPIRGRLATLSLWLGLWLVPLIALWMTLGDGHVLTGIATFFSKLAIVTFGGAYAVLAYLAQEVVQTRGWLGPGEMVDGLGLAETTPGPLILVIEYVAYLAGHRFAGGIAGGLAGAAISLWMTFVPCFLWIFVLAPYIDYLRAMPRLSGALAAITAAVVGVILNLSVWFGLHVLFRQVEHFERGLLDIWLPHPSSLDILSLLLVLGSSLLLLKMKLSVPVVLAASALAGLLLRGLL